MEVKVGNIYHCKTEEEALELLSKLHDLGYKWYGGDNLTSEHCWFEYKEETCYLITKDGVVFGSLEEIIEYKKGDKL